MAISDSAATPWTEPPAREAPAPAHWTLTPRRIGPVQVGMTVAEAAAALPRGLDKSRVLANCDYVAPKGGPAGVSFMVVNGRIARIDVRDSIFRTARGVRVGDPEKKITSLYPGRVIASPHKYIDGQYLTVTPLEPADSAFRIIFETDGHRITRFRSGQLPMVAWVEGCS